MACGFAEAHTVSAMPESIMVRTLLHQGRGPILIRACISRDDVPRVLPTRDGHEIRTRLAAALDLVLGDERRDHTAFREPSDRQR